MESNILAELLVSNNSKESRLNILLSINDESGGGTLPENGLLKVSRSFGTLVCEAREDNSDDASRRLKTLLQALIRTAKCARLSATHRAAACNALCGFLEHGIVSSNLELRTLCFSASTWNQIFDVFIERSEDAKSKPMRQVLITLVKVLSMSSDSSAVRSIRDAALGRLLTIIMLGQDRLSSVKPAMQALEHFMGKQIINMPNFLLRIIQVCPAKNAPKQALCAAAPASHSGERQALRDAPLQPYVSRSVDPNPPRLSSWRSAIQDFIWTVLDCIRINTDLAPAAGRLISSFVMSLQRTVMEEDQDCKKPDVWIRPTYGFMKQHPDLIELFVHHLLPDLLRLGGSTSAEFMKVLPLDDLQHGFTSCLDVVDIRVFLMASKASEELGLMHYKCTFLSMESQITTKHMKKRLQMVDADNHTTPESDFSRLYGSSIKVLLLHKSPSIRLAALNFTTSSKSTTELIPNNIFDSLRECLPQFHAEADAKSRNEFISVAKKLLTRLKGGLAQTSRSRNVSQTFLSKEASGTSIEPAEESSDDRNASYALINCNVRFLNWYTTFLSGELLPTASYPRHITALKLLHLLLQMGLHTYTRTQHSTKEANGEPMREVHADHFNDRIERLLLDLLMDPFDDVRNMAILILKLGVLGSASLTRNLNSKGSSSQFSDGELFQPRGGVQSNLTEVHRRAQDMMIRTGRADHADGAGRVNDLLYLSIDDHERPNDIRNNRVGMVEHLLSDLKSSIKTAKENLRMAVSKAPLHGHLIALRYIIGQPYFFKSLTDSGDVRYARWRIFHDSISLYCTEVWQAVKGVLCVDSPEGYTGEDFEEDDLDIGVKDTLSFSWRALKEASALQHAIITNETYGPPDPALGLQYHDFRTTGGLAFTQLAELRHRGAFSTVSQTFAACCTRCIKTEDSKIAGLPQDWYQDALSCIHEKSSALTRRSAGIPAMITGILVAHPSSCFLENVMLDMQAISDTPVEAIFSAEVTQLPQVHAMNCLKDIFTNTQLGPRTEPYIADTLEIAAGCLESDVWAIQNCGLMLLKALLNKLLGKNEASRSTVSTASHDTINLVYEKFPNLPDLIVKLLQCDTQLIESTEKPDDSTLDIPQAQKLFPALEIIQRAGMPLKHRPTIKSLLLWHLGSTVWYIRKKTAKTISIVTDASKCHNEVIELLQEPWPTQNSLHGRLLCVRELLLMASDTVDSIPSCIIQSLLRLFRPVATQNQCSFTITAYMDVIGDLLRSQALSAKVDLNDKRRLLEIESELWQKDTEYAESPIQRHDKLLSRRVSRYSILAAHHRLDTVRHLDGEESAAIHDLVRELVKGDPDVLHALVTDFKDVIYQWRGQEIEAVRIGISFLLSVICEVSMQDVKAVAMSKLGSILSSHNSRHGSIESTSMPHFVTRPESFFNWSRGYVHPSPQLADGELRLQGAVLSRLTQTNLKSVRNTYGGIIRGVHPLETWIRTLRLAGKECNEPHIRLAAAASLEGFQNTLRPGGDRAVTGPESLRSYLVLYDTLNDDDAEIREKGASIVSWILSEPQPSPSSMSGLATLSLSPLAAKSRFSDFLIAQYNSSAALCYEAIGRLTGVSTHLGRSVLSPSMQNITSARAGHSKVGRRRRTVNLPNIRVSLGDAKREDTALFIEEKQNLYIDEVQEAYYWAKIITKLSPSFIDRDSARELEVWAMQGLAALTELAEAEIDGPLGWTTKPEVFTMGLRIIYAAGVVIHWASWDVASVLDGEIREALRALHSVGEKNCLHSLWMQRIEYTLQ